MKAARILVLGVALAAGGAAAFLVGSDEEKKPEAPAPVVQQLPTVDVLIAKSDIGMGVAVPADSFTWQAWPEATTGDSYVTRKSRPNAIEEFAGAITRAPFTAGEPIREAKLIKANGAAGFMAAILPSGMRAVSTEISPETGAGGFILPERPRRRDPVAARPGTTGAAALADQRNHSHQCARSRHRPDRRGKERPARRRRQDRDARDVAAASRNARAVAAARHAVAGAAQPARRQQDRKSGTTAARATSTPSGTASAATGRASEEQSS